MRANRRKKAASAASSRSQPKFGACEFITIIHFIKHPLRRLAQDSITRTVLASPLTISHELVPCVLHQSYILHQKLFSHHRARGNSKTPARVVASATIRIASSASRAAWKTYHPEKISPGAPIASAIHPVPFSTSDITPSSVAVASNDRISSRRRSLSRASVPRVSFYASAVLSLARVP